MTRWLVGLGLLGILTAVNAGGGDKKDDRISSLIKELADKDAQVRHAAARILADIGPKAKDAVPALIELLKDKEVSLRRDAAYALQAIGLDARAIPALIQALAEEDLPEPQGGPYSFAQCLLQIGPETIAPLTKALSDPQTRVRYWSATLLGQFGSEAASAVPAL